MPTVSGEDKARGRISVQSEWSQHIEKTGLWDMIGAAQSWVLRGEEEKKKGGSGLRYSPRTHDDAAAHPSGPVAGAKAFRQAIDATLQGIPPEQAAPEHEESHIALEEWVDPFKGWEM